MNNFFRFRIIETNIYIHNGPHFYHTIKRRNTNTHTHWLIRYENTWIRIDTRTDNHSRIKWINSQLNCGNLDQDWYECNHRSVISHLKTIFWFSAHALARLIFSVHSTSQLPFKFNSYFKIRIHDRWTNQIQKWRTIHLPNMP